MVQPAEFAMDFHRAYNSYKQLVALASILLPTNPSHHGKMRIGTKSSRLHSFYRT